MSVPDFTLRPADAPKEVPKSEPIKPKRGRPSGSTTAAKNATVTDAELKQALKVMDSLYNMVGMGLLLGQFPAALEQWSTQQEELQKQNATSLAASPGLVRWLCKQGNTGGTGMFLITNAMAFGTLGLTVRGEMSVKAALREAQAEEKARQEQYPEGLV